MTYSPYLIANFATGLDNVLQPWLSPDDSQFELFDGYIYRGVWQKRQGYSQYATGERGGSAYCESRMVHRISNVAMIGVIDGVNATFDQNLISPLRRGSVTVTGSNPVQSFTDDGLGGFVGAAGGIDYTSGEIIFITLPIAPAVASTVTVTYDYHQGLPVMGVMNFITQTNIRQLIVADTTYVNRYNNVTNRLDDISPSTLLTGNNSNFFSWTNYPDTNGLQRLLFVNNKDPIQQYSGSTVTVYPVYTSSVQQTNVASGVTGNATVGPYIINTPPNTGILPGTLSVIDVVGGQTLTDNQFGILQGPGTGTVNYLTGAISATFTAAVGGGNAINLTYKQLNTPIITCRHIFQFKDRSILLSIIENDSSVRGLRIRISGTGAQGDIFTTDAIGAGFIDIPDNTFIQAADFNRDDLLIFTEKSTWVLKYTGNDVVPFTIDKIDDSRGSQAPYGTITYLNKTSASSVRGLIFCDGYTVERADLKIPEYSFNQISQSRFFQCFAGAVDEDRDHYLIHPSPGSLISDRILVTNYEEENYAVYRIPLSCMGNYINTVTTEWDDLLVYDTWDEMADVFGNWYSFAYSEGGYFGVGGGHNGQITRLNAVELEDYPVKIRSSTVINDTLLQVLTDFQDWKVGDYITLDGMTGMEKGKHQQGQIRDIVTDHYKFNLTIPTAGFSSYINFGTASKSIIFESTTKKFNPFANQNQKVKCGWIYFYVSTTDTDLTKNQDIFSITNANPCIVIVFGHGYSTGDEIYINGIIGTTQLNGMFYVITVLNDDTFILNGVDSTSYGVYVSSGISSSPIDAILKIEVTVNDKQNEFIQLNTSTNPYLINLTSKQTENGIKKWYKIWINQIGRFVQFKLSNHQSGAKIEVQAIMPGLQGIGRLI